MRINAYILAKLLLRLAISSPEKLEIVVNKFLDFCRLHNVEYLLPRVLVILKMQERRFKEYKQAYIYTAYPLSSKLRKELGKLIEIDNEAEFILKEDKDLLGGAVVRYRNKIYDASLKLQLEKMIRYLGN